MSSEDLGCDFNDGCQTCQATPGKIVAFLSESTDSAIVDVMGTRCEIDLTLIHDDHPAPGEWVLVHVGFAVSRISEDEALGYLRVLEMLGETKAVREACGFGPADENDTPRRSNQERGET